MQKHLILLLLLCFYFTAAGGIFALEDPDEKNYALGIGNTLFSNLALFSVNRFIGQTEFSKISLESIKNNLTGPWQWDRSMFLVNHLGHPYQGYTYYAAAQANGLNAFESTLVTSLGSYTWEVFGERATPAINDFIVTTVGGVSLGEMLHRIYLDIYTENRLLASLVSPMDAFNDLVGGKEQKPSNSRITTASFYYGAGYVGTDHYRDDVELRNKAGHTVVLNAGIALSYGDPFVSRSNSIFSHFDLDFSASGGYDWYEVVLLSDGVLYSVRRIPDNRKENTFTSYGINLHYDIFTSSLLDFSGNSITFTLQFERRTFDDCIFTLKGHAGYLVLGSSTFLLYENDVTQRSVERRDYGVGGTGKLTMNWEFPRAGTVTFRSANYLMSVLPGTVDKSEGSVVFSRSSIAYKRPLNPSVSLGAAGAFIWNKSYREYLPDHEKRFYNATVFLEYRL